LIKSVNIVDFINELLLNISEFNLKALYKGDKTAEYKSKYWGYGFYQFNTIMIYHNYYKIELSIYMDRDGTNWTLCDITSFKSYSNELDELNQNLHNYKDQLNDYIKKGDTNKALDQQNDIKLLNRFIKAYNDLRSQSKVVSYKK
jgi:hypothetical protein